MAQHHSRSSGPKVLPKVLSREQVVALMAKPNLAAPTGLRNRVMLELMHRCGLRASETCGVHLRDVRWDEQQIHLRPEVAKGGQEAFVPFGPSTEALLRRWVDVRRPYAAKQKSKLLFVTLQGGAVDRRYVWKMVGRFARRAGVEHHVYPHMLRHTFATELLADGFDLREVQTLLRHADIRTTTIYTHVSNVELQAKIRRRG